MSSKRSKPALPTPHRPLTRLPKGGRRRLAFAALSSLLLHTLVAALLVASSTGASASRSSAQLEERPPEFPLEKPEMTLGSQESRTTSITWVGFDEYKRHIADKSTVDQPELTQDDPAGVPSRQPSAAQPQTPEQTLAEATDPAPPSEALPEVTEQEASPPPSPQQPTTAEALDPADPNPVAEGPNAVRPLVGPVFESPSETPTPPAEDPAKPVVEEPLPPTPDVTNSMPPQTTQQPPPSPATPPAGGAESAGKKADRESAAASIITAAIKDLGQPLIAQGLEIKTVRPRFTYYTQLTAAPRDPIVRISFDRNGKVHKAEFVRSSGVQDVDRPVLDAIYKWTASGKQLEGLAAGNPPETRSVQIKMLLNQ